jgi:hypothetical protein
MQDYQLAKPHHRPSTNARWRLALLIVAAAATPVLIGAQPPPTTVLKSGLHSSFGGSLVLTVSDVGSATAASDVTIEFRDAADQRRAFASGVLRRDQPVRGQVQIPASSVLQQFRAIVKIRPVIDAEGSEPVVSLEHVDADTFKVETKPPCAVPSVIPSSGIGAEGNCDGWRITWLAAQQTSGGQF